VAHVKAGDVPAVYVGKPGLNLLDVVALLDEIENLLLFLLSRFLTRHGSSYTN
jgi:hypothetical protein